MSDSEKVFKPVEQTTLADIVANNLRKAIVTGQLKPGQQLVEANLANQMKVSRSPIREALHRLEREGLIVSEPKLGSYVWKPEERDVDEIISLRIILESLAAEKTIRILTEADFAQLEQFVKNQQAAVQKREHLALIENDRRFHEYLCRKADNERLLDWWLQIMAQWEVLTHRRLLNSPVSVTETVLADHAEILAALRRKDLKTLLKLHHDINERVAREIKAALA
ncbi:MAG: GntR family transcriptional regulator [Kiritimatiellae bacterium]|nr:GntR family transcriptional regulator [Kiritimatiellia bacterium]